jgi:hypothetical protein
VWGPIEGYVRVLRRSQRSGDTATRKESDDCTRTRGRFREDEALLGGPPQEGVTGKPMRICKAALLRIAATTLALVAAYSALLCIPEPFFSFSVRADNLILHSDQPFSEAAAKHVLELTAAKLTRSPLYSSRQDHHIFICNARWRQMLFFNKDYGVGGVAPYPVTANVFLRDALIEDNRLISPRGSPVLGDRTLDYFIAHEITHQLSGHAIGPVRYLRLPQWVREGYADYIGKGSSFSYQEARGAFLSGVPEMDWTRSGLYWRFNLEVAYLLDHRRWGVLKLLREPPTNESVDAAIRAETP